MQGWRMIMEDEQVNILDIPYKHMPKWRYCLNLFAPKESNSSYFTVFDGHNDNEIPNYLAQYLNLRIMNTREFKVGSIEQAII